MKICDIISKHSASPFYFFPEEHEYDFAEIDFKSLGIIENVELLSTYPRQLNV